MIDDILPHLKVSDRRRLHHLFQDLPNLTGVTLRYASRDRPQHQQKLETTASTGMDIPQNASWRLPHPYFGWDVVALQPQKWRDAWLRR